MITLTKEWLLKTIAELEEERDAVPGVVNEDAAMALAAMKLALASLEADGTLTNEGTIPANTPCKDAPEHIWLQTAGVWPENGEFSELTWCSDNQHPDDTLYVRADVATGNSPVIPDGWVMVPVEPTAKMMAEAKRWTGLTSTAEIVYREMIAAASPQQEVK